MINENSNLVGNNNANTRLKSRNRTVMIVCSLVVAALLIGVGLRLAVGTTLEAITTPEPVATTETGPIQTGGAPPTQEDFEFLQRFTAINADLPIEGPTFTIDTTDSSLRYQVYLQNNGTAIKDFHTWYQNSEYKDVLPLSQFSLVPYAG